MRIVVTGRRNGFEVLAGMIYAGGLDSGGCCCHKLKEDQNMASKVEHTRHRSVLNFMVNLVAGLISYTRQPKKPTIRLHERDRQALNSQGLYGILCQTTWHGHLGRVSSRA
jgi:hypothetical protein